MREAGGDHPIANGHCDAHATSARSVNHDRLVDERFALLMASRDDASKGDRAGALDVVVERRDLIAITLEDGESGILREILPLDDRVREALLHCVYELIKERIILVSAKALMPNAEVDGIADQIDALGADIERDRHGMEGAHPAADRIKRELSNRDGETTIALIADAEDRRRVGRNDHAHIVHREAFEHAIGAVDIERRERNPARVLVERAELLHRLADGGRVDDGHHLLEMFIEEFVEEDLLTLLQRAEELILRDGIGLLAKALIDARDLLFDGVNLRREQTVEAKFDALLVRERSPLICEDKAEEGDPVEVHLHDPATARIFLNIEKPADAAFFFAHARSIRSQIASLIAAVPSEDSPPPRSAVRSPSAMA